MTKKIDYSSLLQYNFNMNINYIHFSNVNELEYIGRLRY